MDTRRWIAFFLFTMGVVMLFNSREMQRQRALKEAQQQAETLEAAENRFLDDEWISTETTLDDGEPESRRPELRRPEHPEETALEPPRVFRPDRATAPVVTVETDDLRVVFSTAGAVPLRWELKHSDLVPTGGDEAYDDTINLIPDIHASHRDYPFTLEGQPLEEFNEVLFEAETQEHSDGTVDLVLTSEVSNGLQVVKSFSFSRTGFLVPMSITVVNHSDLRKLFSDNEIGFGIGWQGGFLSPQEDSRTTGYLTALVAAGTRLNTDHVKPKSGANTYRGPIHWVGIERKFFLAGLIPSSENPASSALTVVRDRDSSREYEMRGIAPPASVVLHHNRFELAPGETIRYAYTVFTGPKNHELLNQVDLATGLVDTVGLEATIFHNTLRAIRWLSLILLGLLKWFHGMTANYGFAIILLTIMVRVVTYPLTHKSMKIQAKTMAQQARLKPYIDEINKKYADDAAKRNQAMMKLWKEHNVNPFGMLRGCVPVLLQMPIFIALYILLDQAIELRGQSFYWIKDLSMPDRLVSFPGIPLPLIGVFSSLNILPILMGATQVVSSRMAMSAAADPMQRRMMIFMPIAFVFFLYNFPSGLMLYWVVTNAWQIGQQKMTNRLIQREQTGQEAMAKG